MCDVDRVTIDTLPDEVFLDVFEYFADPYQGIQKWFTLLQVCRRWRAVIFRSPRRLKLQLHCKARTLTRKLPDDWPPLPICIRQMDLYLWGLDNIIAALQHCDRVSRVSLEDMTNPQLEQISAAMLQPFPALIDLTLAASAPSNDDETAFIIPDSFLGGSAPCLEYLQLRYIPLQILPKLLMSANGLVDLWLCNIPLSLLIPSNVMATCLSAMSKLQNFQLSFQPPPRSRPNMFDPRPQLPHPLIRFVLPALTYFEFKGSSKYLEDLVAQIDAPLLDEVHLIFSYQYIFDTSQVARFISCPLKLKAPNKALLIFRYSSITIKFRTQIPTSSYEELQLVIRCGSFPSLAHVWASSLTPLPTMAVGHLYVVYQPYRWHDIENTEWLELLRPFTSVENLYLPEELAQDAASAMEDPVRQTVIEVLPALRNLFLEEPGPSGPLQEAVRQTLTMRQLSSHPIAVSHWNPREYGPWY